MLITFTSISIALVLIYLILEIILVLRNRAKLNLLIYVNGTRGKSTTVEYIAAALRCSEETVFAKITGVVPTLITPDGIYQRIYRRNGARVKEQFQVLNFVVKQQARNLVLECMSINPHLQKIETKFLRPDFYIITNIRPDHHEELGDSMDDHIEAFCSALPANSKIITAEKEYFTKISNAASLKGSVTIAASDDFEFPESDGIVSDNVKISLEICTQLGIDKEKAYKDILKLAESKKPKISFEGLNGNEINFYNEFAINDVSSAELLVEKIKQKNDSLVLILNTRKDRPLRSKQFADWIAASNHFSKIILVGNHKLFTKQYLRRKNIETKKILMPVNSEINEIKKYLSDFTVKRTAIICLGNIAGDGFKIANQIIAEQKMEKVKL